MYFARGIDEPVTGIDLVPEVKFAPIDVAMAVRGLQTEAHRELARYRQLVGIRRLRTPFAAIPLPARSKYMVTTFDTTLEEDTGVDRTKRYSGNRPVGSGRPLVSIIQG